MNELPRIGGGVDLSALVRKANAPTTAPDGSNTGSGSASAGVASPNTHAPAAISLPSLVIEANAEMLAGFVKISSQIPVLVNFTTSRSDDSKMLSAKLAKEVNARAGATVLLLIDGDANAPLLKSFQLDQVPAVAAVIKGQPAPLFMGDQEPAVIAQVVDRVLEIARSNGINGVVQVDAAAETPKPQLPVHDQAAYEAIDAGDYELAVKEFEAALAESPADQIAVRGLAEARYMMRVEHLELEAVLSKPAETLQDVFNKADALIAMGHADKAFEALLDVFAVATKEDRDAVRNHLLELFKVVQDSAPGEITAARQRLASLLY